MYTIITKNELGEWTGSLEETAQYIGSTITDNLFQTERDAQRAIRTLLRVFRTVDPDLSEDDFDVIQWDGQTSYAIITKTDLGEWTYSPEETARYIGGGADENRFDTEREAWDAIDQLLRIFQAEEPDLSEDDFDVIQWPA